MKVLQINSYFAGSVFYKDLYHAIEATGISEDIYVFTHVGNEINQKFGENVIFRCPYNRMDRVWFPLKHAKAFADLEKQLDLSKYGISHAHSLFSNGYLAFQTKKKYRVPYIVTVRNTDINVFFKKALFLRSLGNRILENAEKVIFLSATHQEETITKYVDNALKREVENKSVIIPNGVNWFWMENRYRERPLIDPERIRLLYVGNIDRNKNLMTTMKACDILIQRGRNIQYSVVGRVRNEQVGRTLKNCSYAKYRPFISEKQELLDLYRANDIYVMPSKYETFGISYVEAMSQGLPVIYTRGQGFDKHFGEGDVGYSVQYDDPVQIADRIEDIITDYAAISHRAMEKVERFDWMQIGQHYADLYRKHQRVLWER